MSKRYRLLARAEMQGALREPGYVFTLEEGKLGPHRTVVASDHGAAVGGHYRIGGDADKHDSLVDVPLYEEIEEEKRADEHQVPIFDISRDDPEGKPVGDNPASDEQS